MGRPNAQQRLVIEERRRNVALLVKTGSTRRQIAARLSLPLSTVQKDVDAVKRQWRERAMDSYQTHVDEMVAKLDDIEARWLALALSPDAEGAVNAVNVVIKAMERRARLLGLDSPIRHETEVTVTSRSALDEAIETLLAQFPADAEPR